MRQVHYQTAGNKSLDLVFFKKYDHILLGIRPHRAAGHDDTKARPDVSCFIG